MYIPTAFQEDDQERLIAFIRQYSFGTLVSRAEGSLIASHLPFIMLDNGRGPRGTLMGHMARANPQWQSFRDGEDVLAIFQGPDAYITPSWYGTDVSVPTWNYAAVHAYGIPRLVEKAADLRALLEATVAAHERTFEQPWQIERAPHDFIRSMMEAIVGFEIVIDRLEGKFKLSQNRPEADRRSVIEGLRRRGPAESDVADLMAANLQRLPAAAAQSGDGAG